MRTLINAEIMEQGIKLRQLGAKVTVISGKLCYVKFEIGGYKIQYVYNVNSKGNYFLERTKPYPLPLREFEKEEDVIDIIEIDIEQFKFALKSQNINDFINIGKELNFTIRKFEDLFLYYNVSSDKVQSIKNKLHEINKEINNTKEISKRIYFRKEPENI
ncbi:hypothetical protein [Helicovermis profundi]|uniref:Uncharacterized protein n=1 Tax=Helicovermis profundi TaxID=3065157 RepID=A0AAU9EUF3_9FIRM|nr:hypothetical protein HLPR_10310 [Clostridia bacterium S502]